DHHRIILVAVAVEIASSDGLTLREREQIGSSRDAFKRYWILGVDAVVHALHHRITVRRADVRHCADIAGGRTGLADPGPRQLHQARHHDRPDAATIRKAVLEVRRPALFANCAIRIAATRCAAAGGRGAATDCLDTGPGSATGAFRIVVARLGRGVAAV